MRCISEMLSLCRFRDESIDETLSRFEVLSHKSIHGGGMNIGPAGFAWLLLKGMQLSPERRGCSCTSTGATCSQTRGSSWP